MLNSWEKWGGLALLCLAAGCGGKSKGAPDATPSDESVTVEIGEEGGEVEGPAGVDLTIPPGALDEDVEITISVTDTGFDSLPAVSDGVVLSFEPHGLTFNVPVTISLPHDGAPDEVAMFTSALGGVWEKIVTTSDATDLHAEVDHFSFFFNGREVCGLYRQECCVAADGGDGACAGDSLTCIDDRCLECGFEGELCCGGSICHVVDAEVLECSLQGYCQREQGPADAGIIEISDADQPFVDASIIDPEVIDASFPDPDAQQILDAAIGPPDAVPPLDAAQISLLDAAQP